MKLGLVIAGLLAAGVGPSAAAAPPKVSQLVVYRDGSAVTKTVSTRAAKVSVGGRRCTAGDGTALAALVRSKPGKLRLRDFGSCSRRAADGAGLFVESIRGDGNRGQNGWVYKVGRRAASAGAADPGGPFGRGRLRSGSAARQGALDAAVAGHQVRRLKPSRERTKWYPLPSSLPQISTLAPSPRPRI